MSELTPSPPIFVWGRIPKALRARWAPRWQVEALPAAPGDGCSSATPRSRGVPPVTRSTDLGRGPPQTLASGFGPFGEETSGFWALEMWCRGRRARSEWHAPWGAWGVGRGQGRAAVGKRWVPARCPGPGSAGDPDHLTDTLLSQEEHGSSVLQLLSYDETSSICSSSLLFSSPFSVCIITQTPASTRACPRARERKRTRTGTGRSLLPGTEQERPEGV